MCLNSPSHGLALLKAGAKLRKLFGISKFMKKKMLKSNSLRTQKGVNGLSILKKVENIHWFLACSI